MSLNSYFTFNITFESKYTVILSLNQKSLSNKSVQGFILQGINCTTQVKYVVTLLHDLMIKTVELNSYPLPELSV